MKKMDHQKHGVHEAFVKFVGFLRVFWINVFFNHTEINAVYMYVAKRT